MIRTLLVIATLCCAQSAWAQHHIVITETNARFNSPGDNPSWRMVESTSLQLPSRGDEQEWDYSNESDAAGGYAVEYMEPDHPEFASATVAYNSYYALNQFQLTGKAYYEARATGEYYVGNEYNQETFNLGFGTLEVPAQTNHLEEGVTDLKLPATLESTWESETKLPITAYLTAASVGLNNAPLTYVQTRSYRDSIIGSGMITLPDGLSYDALLKKQIVVQLDSFYLNGQPAPAALLTALGVQQGSTTTREIYAFFTPGASTEIMLFIVRQDGLEVTYRDNLVVSNVNDAVAGTEPSRIYPNPLAGESATLEFEKSSNAAWSITISNTLGETVHAISVNDHAGSVHMKLDLPSSIANGFYYYEIRDEHGARKSGGKVVVGRE